MNLGAIITLITGLIPLATQIGQVWEQSGGFNKIAGILNALSSPAAKSLEQIGAQMFPKAAAAVQKVLAAIHLGYPQATKWVQVALNAAQSVGYIHFGAPLVEDGIFGRKTMAAVAALQAKLGVKATSAVTEVEYAALNLILEGKTP